MSLSLKRLLEDGLVSLAGVNVDLVTPASFDQLASTSVGTISVYLYRIEKNSLQQQPRPRDGQRRPLAVDLCYLITAWAARSDSMDRMAEQAASLEEQTMLGLVLQTLHATPELGRAQLNEADPNAPAFGPDDDVQILLDDLPLEDHYRIWDPAELGYRVSLTYRVRVLGLDTPDQRAARRVGSAANAWGASQ